MYSDKMIKRIESDNGRNYGRVGEFTGRYAYRNGYIGKKHKIYVGDVLSYGDDGKAFSGTVMKGIDGNYGIMGRGVDHLNFEQLTITVPHNRVPIEMINALHGGHFKFVEEEAIEMTVEEIEKALGKRIKIVKEEKYESKF